MGEKKPSGYSGGLNVSCCFIDQPLTALKPQVPCMAQAETIRVVTVRKTAVMILDMASFPYRVDDVDKYQTTSGVRVAL